MYEPLIKLNQIMFLTPEYRNIFLRILFKKGEKQKMNPKDIGMNLAYAALDEIPNTKADAKEIVGLVKSGGKVTGYQLSDGETISKEKGVAMAKAGEIQGVGVAHRKDSEYLKSLPDGSDANNLSNLPSVSEEQL